jgi:2-dehydropantoate 2-reductase
MEPVYVVGAGGIGCAVGYTLCGTGARVIFVEANPEKIRWGRTHGVCLDRRPPRQAEFLHFDQWQPSSGCTVLLCTKCYDNAAVLSRLPPSVRLIPIQNGFDASLDSRCDGLEGVASFVSECYPDITHTRITRRGRLHLGARRESPASSAGAKGAGGHAARLIELLGKEAPFRLEHVPNILPYKYTKLMYNAAISPLAAAAGLDNGQLLSVPRARRLFFQLLRENYAILRAARIPLGKIGPFHPDTVDAILSRLPVARFLSWVFYPTLRKTYCSMSGDLPRGRTEIDYYNRHLIELAGDFPCPLNRRVYNLVKHMERERIPPQISVLEELETVSARRAARR